MQVGFQTRVLILWNLLLQIPTQSQAVDSPFLLLESTNGVVYVPANPTTSVTSQSTPTFPGTTPGVHDTAKPAQVQSSLSSTTSTGARGRVNGDSATSTTLSAMSTTLETWPTSITFVSQTGNVTVVDIGFITTSNGSKYVTNTQPQQSLVSISGSGQGQVVITENGSLTTLSLSSLPTAIPLSLPTDVQVVTESGAIVTYSPSYLSGYNNSKPIEVFTTFGENVNGKATSLSGWWLIGAGGGIDPPGKRPWKHGRGHKGCLLGPLFCHTGWIQVGGGLVVRGPHLGSIGPPGYPGGPVNGINGKPDDDPPPNAGPPGNDGEPTTEPTTEPDDRTTASSSPLSSSTKSSSSSSASSGGTKQYYLVLRAGADQTPVNDALEESIPGMKSIQPDLAANVVDGVFYIGYNLTADQARNISSLSEVWVINTYTSGLYSFSDSASSTSLTTTANLATYTEGPAYTSSTGTTPAKSRRKSRRDVSGPDSRLSSSNSPQKESVLFEDVEALNRTDGLQKRDRGTQLVWQVNSPRDLSTLSWAPGTRFEGVDYIMEETKGQNTWVILMDTGVLWQHSVSSLVNCGFPKTPGPDGHLVR